MSADKQPNGRPIKSLPAPSYERIVQRRRYLLTNLNTAAAAVLHQIADVSRFRACSDERPYVVVVKLFQLQNNSAFGVNVTLLEFAAERRSCSNQSIFLARLVYSSQPAAADRRADRQTDDRQFHRPRSSPLTTSAVSINTWLVAQECTSIDKNTKLTVCQNSAIYHFNIRSKFSQQQILHKELSKTQLLFKALRKNVYTIY